MRIPVLTIVLCALPLKGNALFLSSSPTLTHSYLIRRSGLSLDSHYYFALDCRNCRRERDKLLPNPPLYFLDILLLLFTTRGSDSCRSNPNITLAFWHIKAPTSRSYYFLYHSPINYDVHYIVHIIILRVATLLQPTL